MKAGWCIHYTGLVGRMGEKPEERRCKAGVLYESVKVRRETGGISAPCVPTFDHGLSTCALYEAVTPEEDAKSMDIALQHLTQASQVIATGHCPHCAREMTARKVGRCLYAEPCGHRLNEIPAEIKGTEFVQP